ncbi:TRAP transporter small permease [Bacillus alveayuensis]|jgi:TRAP-type transport system small permease protein|uniref:TRAP-type C4-dicarboxylate transport system permease small subunit n=1 Tax=Aeribacillus alveayuensis TaxID=279215 RepID=A0ABT9VPS5_9BACI|nr:TRAP transporter small permease [Bacillus alveayuensis]MDQ0162889.1 TRAP-type C4-dicarboxylate transport system permease small subunit [Bacillus alveayuensis]
MEKIIHMLSKGLHYVAQLILALMMFMVTFDVLGRWLFHRPIKGTVDFTELGLCIVIFLGLAYTHLQNEHITVDFIVEKFPKKIQWIFESVINLLIAGLMVLVAWSLLENSQRLLNSNTVTGDLGLPVYVFAILAAIGAVVFALTALLYTIDYAQKVVKDHES